MAAQAVWCTSNPLHDYAFSWTIENFSAVPDVLRGPSVSRIPGFLNNLYLELTFKQLRLRNKYPNCVNKLSVAIVHDMNVKQCSFILTSGLITFRNTSDEILKKSKTSCAKFEGKLNLLVVSYATKTSKKLHLSKVMNLLDDKLIVEGKLSISGYDISTSSSSPTVQDGSESFEELSNDLKIMYESGIASDFTFIFGEKTLRAHKAILLGRSPVFAKMFDNDMVESNFNEVVIEDADFDVFNYFLKFLYTGIVEDNNEPDTLLGLYTLAHKYQVKSLLSICSRMLGNSMTIGSVCRVLVLSDAHGDCVLKDVAKNYIRNHLIQVIGTTEWAGVVIAKPQLVKEVQTFLGCLAPSQRASSPSCIEPTEITNTRHLWEV